MNSVFLTKSSQSKIASKKKALKNHPLIELEFHFFCRSQDIAFNQAFQSFVMLIKAFLLN